MMKMPVVVMLFGHFNLEPTADGLTLHFDHMSSDYTGTVYNMPETMDMTEGDRKALLRTAAHTLGEALLAQLDEKNKAEPPPAPPTNNFGGGGAQA